MYSRQTSVFRLVLSFLLAFAIFSAAGYAIYRWSPNKLKNWFRRRFREDKGKTMPQASDESLYVESFSLPSERPRRHGRIKKVLHKRSFHSSDEAEESPKHSHYSSKGFNWDQLLEKAGYGKKGFQLDHKGRQRNKKRDKLSRGKDYRSTNTKRQNNLKFLSSSESSLESALASISSSSSSGDASIRSRSKSRRSGVRDLPVGKYSNEDKELERAMAIFHNSVGKLAKRQGGDIAEEYLMNAHKFWSKLDKRERRRARLFQALKRTVEEQEAALEQVQKEKARLVEQSENQARALNVKLAALKKQLKDSQKQLKASRDSRTVKLEELQARLDQLEAIGPVSPKTKDGIAEVNKRETGVAKTSKKPVSSKNSDRALKSKARKGATKKSRTIGISGEDLNEPKKRGLDDQETVEPRDDSESELWVGLENGAGEGLERDLVNRSRNKSEGRPRNKPKRKLRDGLKRELESGSGDGLKSESESGSGSASEFMQALESALDAVTSNKAVKKKQPKGGALKTTGAKANSPHQKRTRSKKGKDGGPILQAQDGHKVPQGRKGSLKSLKKTSDHATNMKNKMRSKTPLGKKSPRKSAKLFIDTEAQEEDDETMLTGSPRVSIPKETLNGWWQ